MNETTEKMDVIIKVFKTDVDKREDAYEILEVLDKLLKPIRVTFDLEDCDRILRVEGKDFETDEVINVLNLCGFYCEVLL
jgi:hypothetical protein